VPGAPACHDGFCSFACATGTTKCGGAGCFDTSSDHDHCGGCTTPCAFDEVCSQGMCCAAGAQVCNGACTDTSSLSDNCGTCGHACNSGQTCVGGSCVDGIQYSQKFTGGKVYDASSIQCTAWKTFQAALTGSYSSIRMSGTNDPTGVECAGAEADTLCKAMHDGTAASVPCNGRTWAVLPPANGCGQGLMLTADGNSCQCESTGYTVTPCIVTTPNWGGVNTATCSPPSQQMTVICK
jgi:hypothetical protein